jgi:hypothetical protein
MKLGFVAFFKVPVNDSEPSLRVQANLQMMFMSRFCKFQIQNRELSYASSVGASRSSQDKIGR